MQLHGMVESWSSGSGDTLQGGQRTALFGAEQDLELRQQRLSLQSELALRNEDVANAGHAPRSFENMSTALRLSSEAPSGRVSYGITFDYVGASFRPDDVEGDELGLRLNGGWALDEATRLSGYLGSRARSLGTENPEDGWRSGLTLRRTLLPESVPGLIADLGLDVSQSGEAAETAAPSNARLRFGLGAELAPRLNGRVAFITESQRDRITDLNQESDEVRLRLERGITLLGAAAQMAGEIAFVVRSGSDLQSERSGAGLSFTLQDGDDSVTLRGRLYRHEDHKIQANSGLGGEFMARMLHQGELYSTGVEAALLDNPDDIEPASYRTGLFVTLPF